MTRCYCSYRLELAGGLGEKGGRSEIVTSVLVTGGFGCIGRDELCVTWGGAECGTRFLFGGDISPLATIGRDDIWVLPRVEMTRGVCSALRLGWYGGVRLQRCRWLQ